MSLKSIFDLPTSKDELEAANAGFSSYKWLQKAALRNITDTATQQNFQKGVITYRWDMASSSYFLPSKCFLRMRCKLTKGDSTTPLDQSDGIGLAMGGIPNLISEANVTVNDTQISVSDRHIGEIEAIYTRLNKSGQWMRDCGNSVAGWEASLDKRIQDVSSDGQNSEFFGGSDSVVITSKLDLGFDAASTIIIAAADHIATFANPADLDVRKIYKAGDIIVVKLDADVFRTAWYVVQVLTATTVQLSSFGTTLAGDYPGAATAAATWDRYRYSEASIVNTDGNVATAQPGHLAANTISVSVGDLRHLNNGDISVIAADADGIYEGQPVVDNLTAATSTGGSFNAATVIAAALDNRWGAIRYACNDVLDLGDAGYVQNNQLNGHAVQIAPDAQGDAILTITRLGTAAAIPDVNDHFKVGDIVTAEFSVAPTRFSGLVIEVDPNSDGASLRVIGEQVLAGARGSVNDGRDYLRTRINHGGPSTSKTAVNTARQLTEFEITWTPRCLSFFRIPHAMPGGGKFELRLTPKNLYREAAIESRVNKTAGTDYNFQVLSMFMYVPTFEGKPHIDKYQFYLDLNEIRAQKVDITSAETSYTLDVRPSTNALCIAPAQSSSVDNNTNFISTKYTADDNFQRKLIRLHTRYGSEQKPIPSFDLAFSEADGRDNWNEVYIRNLLATNAYFDSSCETIQEWRERGEYIYQVWNRSGDDRETRVYITAGYSEAPTGDNNNPKLILFNFYKKYCICKLDNGRYNEILIQEA